MIQIKKTDQLHSNNQNPQQKKKEGLFRLHLRINQVVIQKNNMAKEKKTSTNKGKAVNLARTTPTPNSSLKPSVTKPPKEEKK